MKTLTTREILIWTVALTLLIEGITVLMRFGLGMESTRDTASTVGVLTGGIRIHHGYIGVVMMMVAMALRSRAPRLFGWGMAAGGALFVSDIIHHFVVLWIFVGSPQFHLVYPSS